MGLRTAFCLLAPTALLAAAVACLAGDNDSSPLTLQQAVTAALSRDALVRDAHQSLEDARAALVQARAHTPRLSVGASTSAASSAGLDPQSEVTGTDYSSQFYSSSVSVPLSGGTNVDLFTSASTSTTNSQLRTGEGQEFTFAGALVGAGVSRALGLFRNERVLTEGGRWSAELNVRRAELALEQARRQVVSDTLTYFFVALRAQRQAEIAEASYREAGELLRIAEAKLEVGKLAEIEVMESQVSASSARVSLRQAQSAAATAMDSLRNFLGMPLDQPVQLTYEEATVFATPPDEEALIAQALTHRPDLQRLALGLRQTELSVHQAEAQARPGVRLVGSYSKSGEAATVSESFRNLVNPSWGVGISTNLSLTRAEDRAAIRQARGHLRLAQMNQQLRQDEVRLEVRRLLRDVQAASDNVRILESTVKLAEENLRIRQTQLDHGLIRPIDVMQTERQLSDTRSQHLNAVIGYQLARARLSLAVGEMPFAEGRQS
jgi:outer membrane protein TolC